MTNYQVRQAAHPDDVKHYDTKKLREHFLFNNVMKADEVNIVYSLYDRVLAGGAVPVKTKLQLESIEVLRANFFLERREIGIVNVGGSGKVTVDGEEFPLNYKEALYIGKGKKDVFFHSDKAENPAKFYFLSAPAHKECPTVKVTLADAKKMHLGKLETSNERTINQLLISPKVEVCQLQMGMTELTPGSVWNTMPAHVHDRRMEWYFYFEVPQDQAICHFMGQPDETRHIWMHNEEAAVSPNWSIHSAAGTVNYTFIWGMAGENLDYGDVETTPVNQMK
jgi:4-deoxy-L-threo-5-hexosulose-uronate ketol-isomerase